MTIDGQARIDAARSMEFPGRPNGFLEFVLAREESFSRYGNLTRSLRDGEAQARRDFSPLMTEFLAVARNIKGANPKHLRQVEAQHTERIFSHNSILYTAAKIGSVDFDKSRAGRLINSQIAAGQMPQLNAAMEVSRDFYNLGHGKLDIARATMAASPHAVQSQVQDAGYRIGEFQRKYVHAVAPLIIESRALNGQISAELEEYMTSSYSALPETLEFLSGQEFADQREIVRAFFRELVNIDPSQRNQPNLLSKIREYWQRRGPQVFDPVIFDRFWEELNRSAQKNDIIGWVRFGAIVSQMSRDESSGQGVEEPNPIEIRGAVAKVPFEFWPKPLKDSYSGFAQRDAAVLIEAIRSKAQQIFPRNYSEPVRPAEILFDSKKRSKPEANDLEAATIEDKTEEKPVSNGLLDLAVLRFDPVSKTESHSITRVPHGEEEDWITKLASVGVTPAMREDLAEIIRRIRNKKTINGLTTTKLYMHAQAGHKRMPLWELDPREIPGLSFKDPETARSRIIFVLLEGAIGIESVYPTHEEFDKRVRNKFR